MPVGGSDENTRGAGGIPSAAHGRGTTNALHELRGEHGGVLSEPRWRGRLLGGHDDDERLGKVACARTTKKARRVGTQCEQPGRAHGGCGWGGGGGEDGGSGGGGDSATERATVQLAE